MASKPIDYKRVTELLIRDVISDWRSACRDEHIELDESRRIKKRIATRLVSLIKNDDMPIEEILRIANDYKRDFAFLSHNVDVDELERYIHETMR